MKKTQKIALIIAVMLLITSVLAACGPQETGIDRSGWWMSDEPGRPSARDDLPEEIDLKGYQYTVLYRAGDWINFHECEGDLSSTANPVYQTVYERNRKIQSRLNAKITWIPTDSGGLSETASQVTSVLNTMDYYDFFLLTNNTIVSYGHNASLCDFNFAEWINLEQPWWWKDVVEELSFDGYTTNFLVGDMNLVNITKMSAFYFNFDLIRERLQKEPSYFYKLVDDKKWTIDIVDQLCKSCYRDINGNNMEDDGDSYAFPWTGGEVVNQFIFSTRVADNLYTRSGDGKKITLNFRNNADLLTLVDKLTNLIHNNSGVLDYSKQPAGTFDGLIIGEFAEGKYVFLAQRLTAAVTESFREMQSDYGILPYPLLEEGDDYISDIQSSSTSISAPKIAEKNLDKVSMCIEALCAEAYRYTTVAFYDMALKNKYTRDDDAARMIDLIYDSAHKSFIVEYDGKASGISGTINAAIHNKSSIATLIAEKADSAQYNINAYISDVYKSLG